MAALGGDDVIIKAVEKLGKKHDEHMKVYGEGNERRLTGLGRMRQHQIPSSATVLPSVILRSAFLLMRQ